MTADTFMGGTVMKSGIRRFACVAVATALVAAPAVAQPGRGIPISPLPDGPGLKVCLSPSRRPARDQAPTTAKASCLYPNSAIALREVTARGFDNAVVLDPNGNVAELLTANVWIVKDGVAMTPAANGIFFNGITRRRVISLLRDAGTEVQETTMTWREVQEADEVFSTGNNAKVMPIIQVEERELQAGPVARKARDLYFDYAKDFSVF